MTAAAVERRGDWGGERELAPGCMSVGEHRTCPVCPLCAGRLLHTKTEHDQLEAAVSSNDRGERP
jgi:hypothetical protein